MTVAAIARQALLIPEVVELDEPDCDRLEGAAAELADMGLEIERFGPTSMLVRADARGARQDGCQPACLPTLPRRSPS